MTPPFESGILIGSTVVKARHIIEKHGLSFDEASTSFEDPLSLTIADPLHTEDEERFV